MAVMKWIIGALTPLFLFVMLGDVARGSTPNRVNLFPRLRVGEVYSYQVRYQSERKMRTESAVAAPMAPENAQSDTQRLLQVEVLNAQGVGRKTELRLRLRLTPPDEPTQEKSTEFTLRGDGRVSDEVGTDILPAEDQEIIRAWVAQFAMAGIFPAAGVKQGERWKSQEEVSGAALAGLVWEKEYTYVRDEVCPADTPREALAKNAKAGQIPGMCAVILTREILKKKSSSSHATPEDFKARDLRTAGIANGTNEIVTYIALGNGLLVRGTEEAQQSIDAEVALTDGGNRVRYNIDARSHTEVLMVALASKK
jgi:hypothetical protein